MGFFWRIQQVSKPSYITQFLYTEIHRLPFLEAHQRSSKYSLKCLWHHKAKRKVFTPANTKAGGPTWNAQSCISQGSVTLIRMNKITPMFRINGNLGYNTMVFNSANLGGNVYINNILGSGVDFAAAVVVTLLMNHLSRRNTLALVFVALACFSIASPPMKQCK